MKRGSGIKEEIKQYLSATSDADNIEIRQGRVVEVRDLGDVETIRNEARRWSRGKLVDVDDIEL